MLSHAPGTMHRELSGGTVRRLVVGHVGASEVALVEVRIPNETVHIVVAGAVGAGAVTPAERDRLREAMRGSRSPRQTAWRRRIEGGRVVRVGAWGMDLARGGETWRLGAGAGPELTLEERAGAEERAGPEGRARSAGEDQDYPVDHLSARGARVLEELVRTDAAGRRETLRRAVAKAIARLERRAEAVRGDLARAEAAGATAQRATLFVAEAARAPRGTATLTAIDWSSGEGRPVEMPLDPAREPREQVDAMFKRARRLKEGAAIARARLEAAERSREALVRVAEALAADPSADVDALAARARDAAPRDFKVVSGAPTAIGGAGKTRPEPARARPFRTFLGGSGARILVGRGAAHNDALTLHVARPQDLWLHAKGQTGAHVVVPLDKGASCPPDVLVEAAHLAAHFSSARDEAVVEVQYTPRRYVRKPRGSAPGSVIVDREKVLVLRKRDAVIKRLLERETEP